MAVPSVIVLIRIGTVLKQELHFFNYFRIRDSPAASFFDFIRIIACNCADEQCHTIWQLSIQVKCLDDFLIVFQMIKFHVQIDDGGVIY